MIHFEDQNRTNSLLNVARRMMTAARTAPKARGVDNLVIATVAGDDIELLAQEMERIGPILGWTFFERDAANIRKAEAVVLIGTRQSVLGLNCGYCGYATCAELQAASTGGSIVERAVCFFNSHDLGIAVGAAATAAADSRVDSRVMFSVGYASRALQLLGAEVHHILAIPISASGKSPFFDR